MEQSVYETEREVDCQLVYMNIPGSQILRIFLHPTSARSISAVILLPWLKSCSHSPRKLCLFVNAQRQDASMLRWGTPMACYIS